MKQERKAGKLNWIDLIDPTKEELETILTQFEFSSSFALTCLDHDHLPRLERDESGMVLVLRAFDLDSKEDRSTIQGLTRKISIVQKPGVLITVHRTKLSYLQALFDLATLTEKKVVPEITARILKTYDAATSEIENEFDDLEESILNGETTGQSAKVQELYTLKRHVTLLKRILRMTLDPLEEYPESVSLQTARESLDRHLFKLEEVYDNLIAILSLQISISAHRANEIMRVLTVYSIFFLPLNLIAGIYGMNFEHMPELKWVHGYPMALLAMASVGISILLWLKRRGWLEKAP